MKNLQSTILSCSTLLICLFIAANTFAQNDKSGNPKVNSRSVLFFGTTNVVPNAGSSLLRDSGGVFFTLHTQRLPAGHAVSAWMAIFNYPENCATSPCTPADFANPSVDGTLVNTGGRVIGLDGAATYGAYRAVGDATGYWVGSGSGIVLPLRAEIHLVLRDHGVASGDPAVLAIQLSSFNGGCPMAGCMNVQASVNQR